MKTTKKFITNVFLIIFIIICMSNLYANAEITERDFVSIRKLIDKYESAYSKKDIKGMIECCDTDSAWFKGLESSMQKEFNRYQYIRQASTEKRLVRDKNGTREDDLMCIRRALYIAYIDSEGLRVGDQENNSASLNEYDAVYFLTRTPSDGKWKIKAFGQMANVDQEAYLTGKQFAIHGKIQDAFSEYKKAISINPQYSPAYSGLSDLSFAMRNLPDAIKFAEKAVSLRPEIAYYQYSLGMIYLYAKEKEKALKAFNKAKSLDKEFPDIDYYINNADRIMSAADYIVRTRTINEDMAKVLAIKIEGDEKRAIIKDLNLVIEKPKGWQFVPRTDWYNIVSLSKVERPSILDPIIKIRVRPVLDKKSNLEINMDIAKDLAVFFRNKAIVRLGSSESVKIAGHKAQEDFFAYRSDDTNVIAIVTTFEKNGIAYSIVYTDKAKDMKIDTRPYKEILGNIQFINSRKDISNEMRNILIKAEKSKSS